MDDGYGGKIYADNPDCNATSNGERKDLNIIMQRYLLFLSPMYSQQFVRQ